MNLEAPFLRNVTFMRERIEDPDAYPFSLPPVQALDGLPLAAVTYFVGENGSGKSTILEGLAVAMGFNAEGGSKNFGFSTHASESSLHEVLRPVRASRRPQTGYFLRAESFFNVATEIDRLGVTDSYGGKSLHEQSHGESFLALLKNRFGPNGLYILDEPESALSPSRQLSLLVRMQQLVEAGSQFIIATHAPIVLAYPGATIYRLSKSGLDRVAYDDLEHVQLTRDFLNDRERVLGRLLGASAEPEPAPTPKPDPARDEAWAEIRRRLPGGPAARNGVSNSATDSDLARAEVHDRSMGDKSPKAKDKSKKQNDKDKNTKNAAAANKAKATAPSASIKKTK